MSHLESFSNCSIHKPPRHNHFRITSADADSEELLLSPAEKSSTGKLLLLQPMHQTLRLEIGDAQVSGFARRFADSPVKGDDVLLPLEDGNDIEDIKLRLLVSGRSLSGIAPDLGTFDLGLLDIPPPDPLNCEVSFAGLARAYKAFSKHTSTLKAKLAVFNQACEALVFSWNEGDYNLHLVVLCLPAEPSKN